MGSWDMCKSLYIFLYFFHTIVACTLCISRSQVKHLLSDWTARSFDDLCSDLDPTQSVSDNAVAVLQGNCTFSEKAQRVQMFDASAIIIVSYESQVWAKYFFEIL